MLTDGFAFAYLKYHFSKEEKYRQVQLTATKNNNGIWGNNSRKKIVIQQGSKEIFWETLSPKAYFVSALIIILIFLDFTTILRNELSRKRRIINSKIGKV